MNVCRGKYALGNGRWLEVTEWKGELRVDLREWMNDTPTKKGISLTLTRWKNFIDNIDSLDQALKDNHSYDNHLGGNVYCTVTEGSLCVDIRQYWKPEEKVVPTRKGLCLRPIEYTTLRGLIRQIEQVLPELNTVVPCYLRSDHMNLLGALQCPECTPQ